MKPEHEAFIREAVQVTALLERLTDLIEEFRAAPVERAAVLKAEILELTEQIKRFALHYNN
jgi:hypothetical protein